MVLGTVGREKKSDYNCGHEVTLVLERVCVGGANVEFFHFQFFLTFFYSNFFFFVDIGEYIYIVCGLGSAGLEIKETGVRG